MRYTDDSDNGIRFHSIVPPSKSGLNFDIVRFVRGDGSVTVMGVPFEHAASARIDIPVEDFKAGSYEDELPAQAIADASREIAKMRFV